MSTKIKKFTRNEGKNDAEALRRFPVLEPGHALSKSQLAWLATHGYVDPDFQDGLRFTEAGWLLAGVVADHEEDSFVTVAEWDAASPLRRRAWLLNGIMIDPAEAYAYVVGRRKHGPAPM